MSEAIDSLRYLAHRVFETLEKEKREFALAGGLLADMYRGEPRGTGDIDVVVDIGVRDAALAKKIVAGLGFVPHVVTTMALEGASRFSKKGDAAIVVGRDREKPYGVDLILLTLPWTEEALKRAQYNQIDFGSYDKPVPSLTVEDMLVAKMYAIKNNFKRRFEKSDIPDIALMLKNNPDIDINYLQDRMLAHELVLPKGVETYAPALLSRASRRIRKTNTVRFNY